MEGWYWHVHHDRLVEWCTDYDGRVEYIKAKKPAEEIETRLRLFKPVAGWIPERLQRADAEWKRARDEWGRAYAEWERADAECLPALEALHAVECPGCPWDGKTIFP